MNRIYRTLWSAATQSWQAVPETAKTAGKKSKSSAGGVVASVALSLTLSGGAGAQSPPAINQLPTGGTVARGVATISQTATAQAAAMVVNQSSQRAVVNWNTFNLGQAASINFVQPNAQAVTLNRVNDSNPSQIFGRITANGQVFLTNANGVYFSPTSSVDVGAITATTHSISDDNFMSSRYVFERNGATGKVVNEGNITAALGGYVALLAPEVQNAGVVVARAGTVTMAAGEAITLSVDGAGSLAGITTTPSAIASLVENKLAVLAPDGQIILSAVALDKLQMGLIKNSGSLEANSLVNKGGKIVLEGDNIVMDRNSKIEAKGRTGGGVVLVGGDWQGSGDVRQATKVSMEAGATIDASATDNGDGGKVVLWSDIHNADSVTRANGRIQAEAGPNGGDGGQVETSGHVLNVDDFHVSTTSVRGSSGKWLLDPYNITISTASQTAGLTLSGGVYTTNTINSDLNTTTLQNALASGNVEVSTAGPGLQNGDIAINNAISWSSANTLRLTASGSIAGTGNISMGTGGGLVFSQVSTSAISNQYSGVISGDGSFTKEGVGTAYLTGANTYTGTTTISAGTLQFGRGGATPTATMGTGVVINNGSLVFNAATGESFAPNTISGTGSVTVSGATSGSGNVTLRADNTFSGGITINSGPRVVLGGNSVGAPGSVTSGPLGTGTATLALKGQLDLAGYSVSNTLKSTYNANTASNAPTIFLSSGTVELPGQIDVSTAASGMAFAPAAGATIRLTGTLNANSTDTTAHKLKLVAAGTVVEGFSSINNLTTNKYIIYLDTTAGQWTLAADAGNAIGLGTKASLYLYGGVFDLAGNDLGSQSDGSYTYISGGRLLNSSTITSKIWSQNTYLKANSTIHTPNVGGDIDWTGPSYLYRSTSLFTLTKTGAGDLRMRHPVTNGSNAIDFNIDVQAGNLWFDVTGTSSFSAIYSLAAGTKLYYNGSANGSFPGTITGDGAVVFLKTIGVANSNTTTLSGANTYTGGTTIMNGASITLGVSPVMNGSAIVSSAIGTGPLTLGDVATSTSGTIVLGVATSLPNNVFINGTGTISSGATTANQTISGVIADGPNLGQSITFNPTVSGKTLEVSGSNTYTGPTTINSSANAAVIISHANALGSGVSGTTIVGTMKLKGDITVNEPISAGSSATLGSLSGSNTFTSTFNTTNFTGTTISSDSGSNLTFAPTTGNAINLGSIGVTFSGAGNIVVNGPIVGGSGALINGNTGSLTLLGVNTYTANTTINSGSTLTIGGSGSLGSGSYAGAITNNGGTLKYASSAAQTLSGVISGTGGALVVDGNATVTLGGNNTFTGTTTINSGSNLVVGVGASGALVSTATIVNNGTINFASTGPTTMSGPISGSGLLIKSGVGSTITFSGNNTYTGGTLLSGGTFALGSANAIGSSGTISFGGGTLQFSASNTTDYSSRFSTAANQTYSLDTGTQSITLASDLTSLGGSLTKLGTGTLTLRGANTYSGNTTISAGTLKADSATAFGTGNVVETSGAVLDLNGQTITSVGGLTLNGTGISSGGALINSSVNSASYAGLVTLGSASSILAGTGSITLGNTGTITGATFGLTLSGAAGGSIASVLGTTTGTLTKSGTGTWTLTGANTYTGSTTINGGTLAIGGAGTLGGGSYAGAIINTATFNYASSAAQTLSGVISGTAGTLIDSGTGTLTLTGANTYTGTTTINAGSSLVVGSLSNTTAKLGTGAITVNGNFLISRSGNLALSGVISSATATGGTGNITLQATGTVTVDKTITMTGANSAIYVEAGATSAANTSPMASDVTLTNTITTSPTGTIVIFAGSPATTSTSTLETKIGGAAGAGVIKYKTYNADLSSLSTVVTGTRNFYYRISPTGVTASGITATKTYDGTTNALGYTSGGSVSGLSADDSSASIGAVTSFAFTTANFNDPNAGSRTLTLGGASINTATWSVKGLSITTTGGGGTINKANLVLTGTKTYDGTTTVAGSQLTATGVNSESFTVTGSVTTGLATADVQSSSVLNAVTGLTVGTSNGTNPGLAANYNVLGTTGSSFSVTPATVILTASKTYDGNTNLSGSQFSITGVTVGGVTQTLGYSAGTASLFDANVATTNNYVIGSGLVLSNGTGGTAGTASNYVLPANNYNSTNNRATVNALPITVTLTAPSSTYTYDAVTTYASIASGLTAYTTNTSMVNGDSIASLNYAVSAAGVAQAGSFNVTPSLNTLSVGATASNYSFSFNPLTVSVAKAALTVSGTTVASKTYDRTNTASLSGGTLSGVFSGDTVTLTQAGAFATVNVGTGIAVTANDTLSGASANNYTLTQPTGLSADITAKALTVANTAVANKTYDRTNTASLSGGSLVGVIAGDTVTLTEAGTFATANVGTGIAVTANDSIDNSNYTLTQPTGLSANITAKALTVSGTTVASKTYSGTTTATLSGGSLVGVIAGDTVTLTEAGTFASANAGTGIAVTANDSINNSNYTLTQPTGLTGTINKANATVTATSNTTTYTGLGQSVSGFSVSGLVNNETAAVLTGVNASATGTNAGTYASIPSGTDTNYNLTFVNGALTINKANATVTANGGTVTYTGLAQSVSGFTASGLVNGETTAVLTGVSAGATGTNAGTYASVASGTATNYNLTFVNGAFTINKANATVTASSGNTTYTGLAQSISGFTATGLVNGETASVLTGVSTSGGTGTNAGTYTHTASGTDSNYNLSFVNGALTINKANATVTAGSGSTTYNGAAQSITSFTATGLVNGEATAVLTGVSALGTGTNAGTYTATASGTDSNYNLSFVNGTFTINKAPLSVSLTGQTKVYDGTTNAPLANGSLTLTGFMSGEGATLTQTQGTYNSANVLNATSVTASLAAGNYTASNGTLLSNYVLPTLATGTGSITPARLSATGTKTYDGLVAFDATGLTVSGVNGETFAATGSGTMSSKNVQTTQALASIAGLSLSGNNGALTSNYVALTTSDTQVSVTPLAVNLSAPAASKTYDSTSLYQVSAADLTALSSHLVGGDRVTAADVAYANKDAGTGKRVSLNSVTINDDNGGNNYTVGKLDVLTGVINKATLTVSVVSDARFVTQSDAVGFAGVVYNGLVGGETATVLTPGSITRSNASVNGAGQYAGVLQASGWQSGNYNFSYNAGDYTIVGAHTLLVTVPTVSTTYGTAASYTPTAKYLDSNSNSIVTLTPTVTGNALTVSDGAGGQASFAINAANATLSSSGNVQAGGYNLVASNVVKTGNNFQNLVMTGGLTVTPKVLNNNLGVQAITKVYDGSASISNLGLSFNQPLAGVASGDTVSLVGSGSFDDRHVATNKTVNLSLGLLGTDATNYALATPSFSTNTGSITQLASVTYTGATNGNWSDFGNWAGGAMPDRNNVAQVVIPSGKTVLYNSDQVGTIGSTLAVDGAIRFTSSNAFTLANTVSGAGDLQQRGNGMLTVSGTNTNFSGNLDIGSYQATLNNAQALGAAGHVVSSGGQLSVASGVTLAALHVDGALTVDTAIKTTSDQVYNGALTFLSSGTTQAPNFVSTAGDVDFMSTVSAGSGAMTAQRALVVSAPQGSVLINDQIGRMVKNLSFSTYLSTGLLDTSPYAVTVAAPTIKLFGDVTTFESQTYDGAVRVGNNTHNGNTRLLVSVDPSITFKGTVDDADPTGKVNGLDVRAISLAALAANAPVPTITFENNVGSTSPLASLRLAAGTQSTVAGAMVTDIKTDDTSRRDTNYKGDIVLKGNLTVDNAPEMIAEQLLVPNASQTLTWYTGTPDFKLRLPVSGTTSVLPSNFHLNGPGSTNGGNGGGNNNANNTDTDEGGRQWRMAHNTQENAKQVRANEAAIKAMDAPTGRLVADVQVGNEASALPVAAAPATSSSHVHAQTVNVGSSGAFVQVREFAPQTFGTQQAFVYQLPADTFVHSRENEYIKLSATLSNGANLPRWVKFSAKTRSFSGEAPKHVKSLDVKVTATDRQGKRASTRVRLLFSNGSGS